MKRFVCLLLCLSITTVATLAQEKRVRGYNEISATPGVAISLVGFIPFPEVMYTHGWYIGDHFAAGISAGFSLGAAAMLTFRVEFPLRNKENRGLYAQLSGGLSFWPDNSKWHRQPPQLLGSAGWSFLLKNGKKLNVGPSITFQYDTVAPTGDPGEGTKTGVFPRFIGVRVGYQF